MTLPSIQITAQLAVEQCEVGPHTCIMYDVQPRERERERWTYPRVLMKPLVDPSAYREQMSPMCRKLDILSDMFDTQGEHLWQRKKNHIVSETSIFNQNSVTITFSKSIHAHNYSDFSLHLQICYLPYRAPKL